MGTPQRSASRSEPEQPPPSRQPARRPRRKNVVLIADDVQDTRDLYTAFLESRGFRAVTARDGAEAVAVATSLRPHVIIMDLAMPQLDGISARRRPKPRPKTYAWAVAPGSSTSSWSASSRQSRPSARRSQWIRR